jgi:hypothetical protein
MMPMTTALPTAALLLASALAIAAGAAELSSSPQAAAKGGADGRAARRLRAERELEALLLQTLVATAFTKKDAALFGAGAAGRQWQAMMTEHVARAMAASGQIRIFPSSQGRSAPRRDISARPPQQSLTQRSIIPGWVTVTKPESDPSQIRTVASEATK